MTQRTDRLDSQIRQELMTLLQREMKDPRIGFATVTRVETARDLGSAKVWVSVLGTPEERLEASTALEGAAGFVRTALAGRRLFRFVPEIKFAFDESVERGARISELLEQVKDGENAS